MQVYMHVIFFFYTFPECSNAASTVAVPMMVVIGIVVATASLFWASKDRDYMYIILDWDSN